jgi:hypothetical protein
MGNQAILAKIKALAARTVENGCTEAEAFAAAAKLAELMDAHGFAEADLEEKEAITQDTYFAKGKQIGAVAYSAMTIAAFCDVKCWGTRSGVQSGIKFLGRESDVAVATYLIHLFHGAMNSAWKGYYDSEVAPLPPSIRPHGRTLRKAFEIGMINRLNERLRAMKAARNATVDAGSGRTGRDIVLVKNAEVEEAFKALSLSLRSHSGRKTTKHLGVVAAGAAAADRVSITTGVGSGPVAGLLT